MYEDPLVKIQIFVNYLEILWYDEASFVIPEKIQIVDESMNSYERIFMVKS